MASTAPFSHADRAEFKQSESVAARATWMFHLTVAASGADATGLVPVATISKAGGAFGAVNGATAITELTNGWYKIVHNAADFDTLGELAVRIAVATADTLCVSHKIKAQDDFLVTPGAISSGTAQAGAAGTVTLAAGESAVDHFLEGELVKITAGTGKGQIRLITGYVGATKVATVDRNWATNPDNTSVYELIPTNPILVDPVTLKDGSLTAAKIASDALAAMAGKLTAKPTQAVGTLTAVKTVIARSMRHAYDTIVSLNGVFNGATVRVESTEDENAAAPVWTDQSAGGLVANGSVTITGPHSAWRARVSAGAVTSVVVSASDRTPQTVS